MVTALAVIAVVIPLLQAAQVVLQFIQYQKNNKKET